MTYQPISMRQEPKPALTQKQTQTIIMSPQMQQAIKMLQLPILELEQLIEEELVENPLLERVEEEGEEEFFEDQNPRNKKDELDFSDETFSAMDAIDESFDSHFRESESYQQERNSELESKRNFYERNISTKESLHENLIEQARELCSDKNLLHAVECIIGNLEENGLFLGDVDELALLHEIDKSLLEKGVELLQSLDPPGIGARSMRENFLIQLRKSKKNGSLAYQIVESFYDELLQNKIPLIAKGLKKKAREISAAIHNDLAKLHLQPAASAGDLQNITLVPDIEIYSENEGFLVKVNNEWIPDLRIRKEYLKIADSSDCDSKDHKFFKEKISSAKWLMKNLSQRSDTLERLAKKLLESQKEFFSEQDGELVPLKMKTIADELELHESTIARAVSNKYLSCDRGIFPLRYFFTNALTKDNGDELSTNVVKELLKSIVAEEEKSSPLSDAALSRILLKRGVYCARRTVAKYRRELKIGSTRQRREFR